ncbi:hypothetical protein CC86DRAFT_418281 [Ophiobolus disseminans]|uniref:Uncharacterized protein n=1 Tax=Ophiobolus disseminans TaxID=1469910 RepID=A0A6A6ZY22_9PLEO|nr:hypothetical protein CC86DRAFT_418281 [Ophiobolus disseminans]
MSNLGLRTSIAVINNVMAPFEASNHKNGKSMDSLRQRSASPSSVGSNESKTGCDSGYGSDVDEGRDDAQHFRPPDLLQPTTKKKDGPFLLPTSSIRSYSSYPLIGVGLVAAAGLMFAPVAGTTRVLEPSFFKIQWTRQPEVEYREIVKVVEITKIVEVEKPIYFYYFKTVEVEKPVHFYYFKTADVKPNDDVDPEIENPLRFVYGSLHEVNIHMQGLPRNTGKKGPYYADAIKEHEELSARDAAEEAARLAEERRVAAAEADRKRKERDTEWRATFDRIKHKIDESAREREARQNRTTQSGSVPSPAGRGGAAPRAKQQDKATPRSQQESKAKPRPKQQAKAKPRTNNFDRNTPEELAEEKRIRDKKFDVDLEGWGRK